MQLPDGERRADSGYGSPLREVVSTCCADDAMVWPVKAIRLAALLLGAFLVQAGRAAAGSPATPDLWSLGREQAGVHRCSTLFTAQDVRGRLASEPGLAAALDWCKQTAVTRVFLECFRDGYQTDRSTLSNAMVRFRAEGFEVSGCVTPTQVGNGPRAGT